MSIIGSKNAANFDDYLEHLASVILERNYSSKEEIKADLMSHYAIMMTLQETPYNETLMKRKEQLLDYLKKLQQTNSPKIANVGVELAKLNQEIKRSNIKLSNANELNRLVNLRRFIVKKFGNEWLKEWDNLEDKFIEL